MDAENGQQFPFRTLSMLCSLVCILCVSLLARLLFLRHILPPSCDVFQCFQPNKEVPEHAYGTVDQDGSEVPRECTKL